MAAPLFPGPTISKRYTTLRDATVREQGLPIRPTLNVPNRVTAEAIAHTERILAGEIADDGATFDNAAEAIEYLDNVK